MELYVNEKYSFFFVNKLSVIILLMNCSHSIYTSTKMNHFLSFLHQAHFLSQIFYFIYIYSKSLFIKFIYLIFIEFITDLPQNGKQNVSFDDEII